VKTLFVLLFFHFSFISYSSEFKVMSFNTLCDFCTKDEYDSFDKRKVQISTIIKNYSADLISLQEVRTGSQIKEIFQDLSQYQLIYADSYFLSYADAAIAINTKKFKVVDQGSLWLGPNDGSFSFGWKAALPRIVVWGKLQHLTTNKEFLFLGSHFDNRVENMIGSAKQVQRFIRKENLPVIFAADTNATTDFRGYSLLIGSNLVNAYDVKQRDLGSSDPKELCYLRKGDDFPSCRVDHILYSKDSIFKPLSWTIDTTRFGERRRFPSDHRPVMASFSL
jgi:endonuclease/exonuclease/phosphatase family metal-dependent hydrolase